MEATSPRGVVRLLAAAEFVIVQYKFRINVYSGDQVVVTKEVLPS